MLRLPVERPASIAMNWRLHGGRRMRERPRMTWRMKDLNDMGIDWRDACRVAEQRDQSRRQYAPTGVGGTKS